jgi:hypothetical protein
MPYYETDHLQDIGLGGSITVQKIGWEGVDWIHMIKKGTNGVLL